ncbi:hypothetical protein B7494_g4284 [Chlorociboria aeruginascens]|nr:hypothetical protein B7494_g4284 [Chlorociboria aeruginascens]
MSSGLKLKLNLGPRPSLSTPPVATPGASKGKLKLNTNSNPPTPSLPEPAPKPKKTKTGRATKPSAKVIESRKRGKDEDESDDGGTINVVPPAKKIKISLNSAPKTPITPAIQLKAKVKGKPPKRAPGEGYDSEASDREIDPMIEEEFILRMLPGDDCDYLRKAIGEKRLGIPKSQGGADVFLKFFDGDGRKAMINIRGHMYAATLVDLPCVIEGMKSWDKRGWWKSADICQMLWVFAPIQREDEAKTIAPPKAVDPVTYQYPHGITPPMQFARKRRFRKRISRTAIEAVEDAVEKLLEADAKAVSSSWEMIDPDGPGRESQAYSPDPSSPGGYEDGQDQYSEDEDAEGEIDDSAGYFGHQNGGAPVDNLFDQDMEADLEADLEAAMQAEEAATPVTNEPTPSMLNGGTPAETEQEEDSGDESIEGDDGGDADGDGDIDEDEKARQAELRTKREDIADMERALATVQAQLAVQANPILRRRLDESIRKIKAELQLKKSSIGEGEED